MARQATLETLGRKLTREFDRTVAAVSLDAATDPHRLRDLQLAARHVEAGTYGLCIDCECDIPLKRLRARPEAVRCIECQKAYERRQQPAFAAW